VVEDRHEDPEADPNADPRPPGHREGQDRHGEKEGRPPQGSLPLPGCVEVKGNAKRDDREEVSRCPVRISEQSEDGVCSRKGCKAVAHGAPVQGHGTHCEEGQDEVPNEPSLVLRSRAGVGHDEVDEEQNQQKGDALKAEVQVAGLEEREFGDDQQGEERGNQFREGSEGATTPPPRARGKR